MNLDTKDIKQFQRTILMWYEEHNRDLPWRTTRDPYRILISEVMSQQTQIGRVIPKFEAWLQAFPTIIDLAKAPVGEVLRLWSGLGYNRRALNLKKTAEIIVKEYGGVFPQTEKQLLQLPGIGEYTARALLCFAFDQQIAVVDTNVRKVILTQFLDSRFLASRRSGRGNDKELQVIADQLLPKGRAYEWNQALMDYAGSVLKKEKIVIPKQSKFIGSHRYYRGQILKQLLQKQTIAVSEIGSLIKKDYTDSEKEWLQKLIGELQAEGFIEIKNNNISLAA